MQNEKNYSTDLLSLLFDQFNEKTGTVEDIEIYKAPELDYVEESANIVEVLLNSADFSNDRELRNLYENEWVTASDVFDYLIEIIPKGNGLNHEVIFSYSTTGVTGTYTSYNLFTWNKKAIFYETADGFTPRMYVIKPVVSGTDLTNLTVAYFLKEGFPSVDLFSLNLNPKRIDPAMFRKVLSEKISKGMASAKGRSLTEKFREMLNAYSEEALMSNVKEEDLKVIIPFREDRLEGNPQQIIEPIVPYLFENSSGSEDI